MSVSKKAIALVVNALDKGLSTPEIIEVTGLGRSTVYRAFQELGINPGRDGARTSEIVCRTYAEGCNLAEVARAAQVTPAHVFWVLNQAGIQPNFRSRTPYDPDPYFLEEIDPAWAAEFRGLFYGEGCAGLENQKGTHTWRPYLIIRLRLDDALLIQEIYNALGGYYRETPGRGTHNPQAGWMAYGWPRCRAIIETTGLDCPVLPAKKVSDIVLLYEAILVRYSLPLYFGEAGHDLLTDYRDRIKAVKRFQL